MTPRRLVLHFSVSIDGFSTNGAGAPDWQAPATAGAPDHGGARHQANVELVAQMGLIALGRVAYEDMVQAWPGSDSPMARLMNTLPKVVFSSTLDAVDWENARLESEPIAKAIPRLKAEGGGDIIAFGGATFLRSLIAERLVDEYRLTVHPVALGRGVGLMHGLPEPQRLELVNSATYADGTVVQTLRPERGPR